MSKAHYFYLLMPLPELQRIVEAHQLDFEELINDTFSETELESFEKLLDSISAIFVQPIMSELTFDDFFVNANEAIKQKSYFDECKSSVCIENISDFHNNPFQVTYLVELLRNFDDALIDTGGVNTLVFKKEYLEDLKKFKNIFSLIPKEQNQSIEVKTSKPVDPIDFLILDVYKELDRLRKTEEIDSIEELLRDHSEKLRMTFLAIKDEKLDASALLKKSGLNAKDFDDNLERLKFFLKKIV